MLTTTIEWGADARPRAAAVRGAALAVRPPS